MANGLQRFSEAPAGEPGAIQQDKGQPGGAAQGADTGTGQDKPARQGEGRGKPPAFAQVLAQAKATQARYPGFQLAKELGNPAFGSLLAAGAPVRAAYELAHRRELILAAMGYAVRRARQSMAQEMAQGRRRPAENAMVGHAAPLQAPDPRQLTGDQRRDLRRRVAQGEKVYW